MNEVPPNTNFTSIMSSFQQVAKGIVAKYCSIPLPYKPGLYSIYWESSCRIAGLLNELQKAADDKKLELERSKNTDAAKAEHDFNEVITHSLIDYTEKIFTAEYPDSEQPDWMLEIAERLHITKGNIH